MSPKHRSLLTHLLAGCIGAAVAMGLSSKWRSKPDPGPMAPEPPGIELSQKTPGTTLSENTSSSRPTSPPQAKSRFVDTEFQITETRPKLPKEDFQSALNNNDFEAARDALQEMEKQGARSRDVLESTGRLLTQERKWDEAKAALKECVTAYPKSHECWIDLPSVELHIGTKEEQSKAVGSCLAIFPNDPQCRNMSAIVSMNHGRHSEAVSIYQKLIQDNGSYGVRFDEPMLHWQLGIALEGAGRLKEASESFDRACRGNFPGACARYEETLGKI